MAGIPLAMFLPQAELREPIVELASIVQPGKTVYGVPQDVHHHLVWKKRYNDSERNEMHDTGMRTTIFKFDNLFRLPVYVGLKSKNHLKNILKISSG